MGILDSVTLGILQAQLLEGLEFETVVPVAVSTVVERLEVDTGLLAPDPDPDPTLFEVSLLVDFKLIIGEIGGGACLPTKVK